MKKIYGIDYYTTNEAAQKLGKTAHAFDLYAKRIKIPVKKLPNGRKYYLKDNIDFHYPIRYGVQPFETSDLATGTQDCFIYLKDVSKELSMSVTYLLYRLRVNGIAHYVTQEGEFVAHKDAFTEPTTDNDSTEEEEDIYGVKDL